MSKERDEQDRPYQCPKCKGEMLCPCRACSSRNQGKVVWKSKGYKTACGHCGYTLKRGEHWIDPAPPKVVPQKERDKGFEAGVLWAVARIVELHDDPVCAADVLRESGFGLHLRRADIADRPFLKKIQQEPFFRKKRTSRKQPSSQASVSALS